MSFEKPGGVGRLIERLNEQDERTEGWGSLDNATNAHYFRERRSLCGKWLVLGGPRWESFQGRGPEPERGSGTCKPCWKKAPEVAPPEPARKEDER